MLVSDEPMTPRNSIHAATRLVGAVLVGGESRRMGRDKALLEVDGQTLAERTADVLAAVVPRVVLVTRGPTDDRFPNRPDRPVVADRFPGRGPLAGLHAALIEASGAPVFLTACDLPGLTPELVDWVIGSEPLPPHVPAARIPTTEGRLQPLCGLYGAACQEPAEEALRADRLSMHDFLDRVECTRLPLTSELPFYEPDLLANWNTPHDVTRRSP